MKSQYISGEGPDDDCMGHFLSWKSCHEAYLEDQWIDDNYPREYESLEEMEQFHDYCVKEYGSGLDFGVKRYVVWKDVNRQVKILKELNIVLFGL